MSIAMRAVLLVVLAGCLDKIGPDVGPPRQVDPQCDTDSDPAHDVSFARDIFGGVFERDRCISCHTSQGNDPIGLQQSGLDLASYSKLRAGGGRSGAAIVIDGQPCESILYEKIGPSPPFGARMPLNMAPVPPADLALVHDWIAEGAHDN